MRKGRRPARPVASVRVMGTEVVVRGFSPNAGFLKRGGEGCRNQDIASVPVLKCTPEP